MEWLMRFFLFSVMYIDITEQHYYAAKSAKGNKKYL
jgi:hypothetical protein